METRSQTPPPKGPKERKAEYERARVTFDKTISGHYRDGKTGYKDVGVLFITWEEDDLQCKETEVDALNDLFTNEFKYSTECYQIPSEKWQTGLMRKVSDFMWQYDSPDCLAIIYYGGHGYEGEETKKFKLAAKFEADENGDPTVFFNDIRTCARLPACDQLMIIDCCFAAKAFARESIGKRKFELLTSAAANERSVAPHVPGSFTSNLNKVLRRLLVEHPNGFSTTHLYRELYYAELKTKPLLFDQSRYSFGRIWLRPQIPAPEPKEKGKITLLELTLRLNGEPHGTVMNELATHLQYLPHTEEVRIENLHAPIDQLENFMLFVLRAQKLRPLMRRLCARRQFQKVARIVEGNDMAHPINLMELHLSHKHVSLFDWSSAAECPPSNKRKSSTWPPTEAIGMAKRKKLYRSQDRRPSNERERRISPILYGCSPNDPQSGYLLDSIPNENNVPGSHSLDRSLAGSSNDSDSDSDMQSAQEPLTTFGKNRNKFLKAKSSNKQTGQFRPKIGQEKLLHTPRAYYNELCELKSRIYQKSALAALNRHTPAYSLSYMSASGLRISLANDDVIKSLGWLDTDENDEVYKYCGAVLASNFGGLNEDVGDVGRPSPMRVLDMVQSRNIIYLAFANLVRLERSSFIHDQISILVADKSRPHVASTVVIKQEDVLHLAQFFQGTISELYRAIQREYEDLASLVDEAEAKLSTNCRRFLDQLGLHCHVSISDAHVNSALALVLDLGVVSYAHAHVESFGGKEAEATSSRITVPQSLGERFPSVFALQRYPTRCLNEFFGGAELWVFHDCEWLMQPPLYISTAIDIFADLWGPVWQIFEDKTESSIHHYDVGKGTIVPWALSQSGNLELRGNERFCHFLPKEQPFQVTNNTSNRSRDAYLSGEFGGWPFSGKERLLVGAGKRREYMKWSRCECTESVLEARLRGRNQLQQVGTKSTYTYVDSRTAAMVGGSYGITFGGSVTVKRANGVFFKDVLFDRWQKQPATRDPEQLANLWGLAISLCTNNAERVSLFELLDTPSIYRYLETYKWSCSGCRAEYMSAVQSGNVESFCNLWRQHRQWQEELGKVVGHCLQILYHTGLDKDRDEFAALWVSPGTTLPKRILLKPSDHNWIKLLSDSEVSFTVAVVVEDCLGARFGRSRCGWTHGRSALQTSLCINDEVEPSEQIIRRKAPSCYAPRWEEIWDVSNLKRGSCFLVAPGTTRLKIVEVLGSTRVLLEWDLIWRDALRAMMGMQTRSRWGHWEYTEVTEGFTRPVPIYLVASDS